MKKLISLFTALFLLMSTLPAQAGSPEISDLLTEYYKERQELPFGLTEEELTCVDGVLYGRDILLLYPKERTDACFVIPDGIGYVWDFAFMDNDSLEKVVVPDSCKILGAYAFWACSNLAEVEFGANSELLIVDDFCFSECYALQRCISSEKRRFPICRCTNLFSRKRLCSLATNSSGEHPLQS